MAWIEESELPDVPAIFQAMSLKPEALDVVKRLNEVLSFGNSGLSRIQEEGIATVISVANRCRYGAMTHAGFLRRHSQNLEITSHFLFDYTQADLSSTDRRILDFAVQVTQEPSNLTEDDVDQLRDVGLDEPQILSVVLIACLANFMDRLANSLGVDLEPRHRRALENWLTGPAAQQEWLMPPPAKPPPDALENPKHGTSYWKVLRDDDSPNGTVDLPEGGPADPGPDASPPQADDFLRELEDIVDSGVLTNGPATGYETEEGSTNPMASDNRSHEEPEKLVDAYPADQIGHQSETPTGQSIEARPSEPTGDADEVAAAPVSDFEDNPAEQSEASEDADDEPQQSMETKEEEESTPPIDVNPLIIRFVEECCTTSNDQAATARELYIAYLRWCDEHDKRPLRQRDFGVNLSGMGFLRQRRARGRHWWIGIGMTPKDEWAIEDD